MKSAVPRMTAHTAAPPWPVLQAPSHWHSIDFISDLHLQASEADTFCAWQNYMQNTRADAVFILGDLFEVWVGDDVIGVNGMAPMPDQSPHFEARCGQVIQAASQRLDIFLMHGNRDFLLGATFAKASGMTLLDDPCALDFAGQRWLLSHGDALCLDDIPYMQFRAQVRSENWQREFLAKPLTERLALARDLRTQSETRKRSGVPYPDVNAAAACDWLRTAPASTLIHGHTHQPADHDLAHGLRRIVLSDWDLSATPPRAEILRLSLSPWPQTAGCTIQRIPFDLTA